MSQRIDAEVTARDTAIPTCPHWCVAPHGLHGGEEDWLHLSEPLVLTDRVLARVCMTVEPSGANPEGPIVLVGSTELSPSEANAVGMALQALARVAESTTRSATTGKRSPGP